MRKTMSLVVVASALCLAAGMAAAQGTLNKPLLMTPAKPALAQSGAQEAFYANRLKTASPTIKAHIAALQTRAQQEKWTFTIGYTTALDRTRAQLTGAKIPANIRAMGPKQALFATDALKIINEAINVQHIPHPVFSCSASSGSFDWRLNGKVSPVKDQYSCGSCWAFGALSAYEASYAIHNNVIIDTSEQHALECSAAGSCGGGWFGGVWDWMHSKKVTNESVLPYVGHDAACPAALPGMYQDVVWGFVNPTDPAHPTVAQIKAALCQYGPLAVALFVGDDQPGKPDPFRAYTGGVLNVPENGLTPDAVDHIVTIIGWDDANQAWVVKNSWGTGWGDHGFFKIKYGLDNIGLAAAWVVAPNKSLILPPKYYELVKLHLPIPEPGPEHQLPIHNTTPLQH